MLTIRGFGLMKFLWENFCGALARSAYYLHSLIEERYLFYNELCASYYLAVTIHCFHEYQAILVRMRLFQWIDNTNDHCTVSVMKGREVVGYVCALWDSHRIYAVFRTGRYIMFTVTGNSHYIHDLLHKYSHNNYYIKIV